MNAPHTIRLRGPWEYRLLDVASSAAGQHGRVDISKLDLLPRAVGKIELMRRFNKPTGLEGGDRVELIIGPKAHAMAVDLNDEPLSVTARSDELRYDITAQLQSRNILRIVVDTAEQRNVQLDEVRLEIHTS